MSAATVELTIEVDGRTRRQRYLAGMAWANFENPPRREDLVADAARVREETGVEVEWVAVRVSSTVIQAGFCEAIDQRRPSKLVSLAATIADSQQQPWLGIFQVDEDTYWYIAVRDQQAVLPNGDVIGSYDEILAVREAHSGYADWNYVEGTLADLEQMITDGIARDRTRRIIRNPAIVKSLRPRFTSRQVVAGVLTVATLGAAGAGAYYWWVVRAAEQREAAAAIARREISKQNAAATSPVVTIPMPNELLRVCHGVTRSLPISAYGWMVDSVACAPSGATVVWNRAGGATVRMRPQGEVGPDGEKIIQSLGFENVAAGDGQAIALSEASVLLRGWAQGAGFSLRFVQAAAATPAAGGDGTSSLQQMGVTIEMPYQPFVFDFAGLPGLRLTSVRTKTGGGWVLEGVLYGR